MRKLVDKDQEIIREYLGGKSTYELEKEYGISRETIRKLLVRNGTNRRSISETNHLRFANHTVVSGDVINMVEGWMLGDGGMHYTGKQAYFCLTSKYKEYITYADGILSATGLHTRTNKVINKEKIAYKLFTASTIQISDMYKKWYLDGKKIIPSDFILTKAAMKNWIMDDGTRDKSKGHLRLCTCSFSTEECDTLSDKINEMLGDSKASWVIEKKRHPRIYLPRVYANKLFNMLGNCDVDCFKYKWGNLNKSQEVSHS